MATETTTLTRTTDEEAEEESQSLPQKAIGAVTGAFSTLWGWVKKALFLINCFVILCGVLSVLSPEKRVEDTFDSSSGNREMDGVAITEYERRCHLHLRQILRDTDKAQDRKSGKEARQLVSSDFPENAGITVTSISFDKTARNGGGEAILHYETDTNREVTLTCQNGHLIKTTRKYGSHTSHFLQYFWWFTAGKFITGYPAYTYEIDVNDVYDFGIASVKKEIIKRELFGLPRIYWEKLTS